MLAQARGEVNRRAPLRFGRLRRPGCRTPVASERGRRAAQRNLCTGTSHTRPRAQGSAPTTWQAIREVARNRIRTRKLVSTPAVASFKPGPLHTATRPPPHDDETQAEPRQSRRQDKETRLTWQSSSSHPRLDRESGRTVRCPLPIRIRSTQASRHDEGELESTRDQSAAYSNRGYSRRSYTAHCRCAVCARHAIVKIGQRTEQRG